MRHLTLPAGLSFVLVLTSSAVVAQELTPGKYSGTYNPVQLPNSQVSIVLSIKSVDGGTVTGTGERHVSTQVGTRIREGCIGGFPITGTVKGDALDVRAAEKWGPAGDCQFRMTGTVSGNKISGKIGPSSVELSR